ncbi:MAG: deoxyguanosinetriphosphate triphosphohydrolase, partial [Steroidobacter sp.]
TFETREGILKHCSLNNAKQLGELGERFIHRHQPSLEAQVADLADAIAYNNHDLDDGIRAGLITLEEAEHAQVVRMQHAAMTKLHPDLSGKRLVSEIVRHMIDHVVTDVITTSAEAIGNAQLKSINDVRHHGRHLIQMSEAVATQHRELKQFLREKVYRHYRVLRMTTKAQQVVTALFTAFMSTPELMPPEYQHSAKKLHAESGMTGRARIVADYIAGMTDRYAVLEHERVFDPAKRS